MSAQVNQMNGLLPPCSFSSALRQPITPPLCAESRRKRRPLAFTLRPPRLPSAAIISPTSSAVSVRQARRACAPPTPLVPEQLLMLTRTKRNTKKYKMKMKLIIKAMFKNCAGMGQGGSDPAGPRYEGLSLHVYYPEGC